MIRNVPKLPTDLLAGIVRKLLDALKIDRVTSDVLPYILDALKSISLCKTSHLGHRDIVTFITYALHDEQAFPSAVSSVSKITRNGSIRSPRPETASRMPGGTSGDVLTKAEIGVKVLEMYAEVLCAWDSVSATLIKKFDLQVPPRVSHLVVHILASVTKL